MFHSMDVANWWNHLTPDTVTDDWIFHCLTQHIAELVKIFVAGRPAVMKEKKHEDQIAAVNKIMKQFAKYLCESGMRFTDSKLEWPAGGMPAGYSSISELQYKFPSWFPFQGHNDSHDKPIVPMGMTSPEDGDELIREIAQAITEDDSVNAKAKTIIIHGFTFPKRSDPHVCSDKEYSKFMLTPPVYDVIRKKLSPEDHWVDWDGIGYRPEILSTSKTRNQLGIVAGDHKSLGQFLLSMKDKIHEMMEGVYHIPWPKPKKGVISGLIEKIKKKFHKV